MIRRYKVKAELFHSADHEEHVFVKANTKIKAIDFAIEKFKRKYPEVGNMIKILDVKEV